MPRRGALALALFALALPPFALGGEQAQGPASLSVSASLGGCGLAEASIVCEVAASWSALDGAEHYTVSVTRPDGSVIDFGEVGGTSRSLFVPYSGPGTYSIQVAAWGEPDPADDAEPIATEETEMGGGERAKVVPASSAGPQAEESGAEAEAPDPEAAQEGEPVPEEPVIDEPEPAEPEAPDCEPEPEAQPESKPESEPQPEPLADPTCP